MKWIVLTGLLITTFSTLGASLGKPTGSGIVDSTATLELVYSRPDNPQWTSGLTEGPTAAPDGKIYFTDYPIFEPVPGQILCFDPKTKKTEVFAADSKKANGLKIDANGFLLACEGADGGGRQVVRWDLKQKTKTTIAGTYEGKKFNSPNDLALDRKGRIYFSDPRYVGPETVDQPRQCVYRIDLNGTVSSIIHDLEKPNGVALSPDDRTLYVAEHNNGTEKITKDMPAPKKGAMKVWAYPLDANGKVSGLKRLMIDFGSEDGVDGMITDAKGNLYVASRSARRPGVLVLDPQAKEVGFIPTGPSQPGSKTLTGIPSNVTFGAGSEKKTLYITVDKSLYRIPTKVGAP